MYPKKKNLSNSAITSVTRFTGIKSLQNTKYPKPACVCMLSHFSCVQLFVDPIGHSLLDIEKVSEFQKNIYFCFIDYAKAFDCVDHNKLWKILKQKGIPDHLTCLLRNLYASQEATVRTIQEQCTGSKLGKEYVKVVYCHPAYLTYMHSTSCEMLGWNQDCCEKYQ